MKKISIFLFAVIIASSLSAQTYTIISRNNVDTIKMYPSALGNSVKSMIPGSKVEEPQYRLIKKVNNGKESLIFVDFTKILDKILVAYETDIITPGEWQITTIKYEDLYDAVVRRDAIYLSGEILGMKVEMFQRPPMYEDLVRIDGIEFPLPLKLSIYESELAKKIEKEKERILEQEAKIQEKEAKIQEREALIRELSQKEENKAYIAVLFITQRFDQIYKTEVQKYFSYEDIQNMIRTYSIEELKKLAQGHDKYFEKYKVSQ